MNKFSVFVLGTSIGLAIGALTALALAPRSGQEMREIVVERATNLADDTRDFNVGAAAALRKNGMGIL